MFATHKKERRFWENISEGKRRSVWEGGGIVRFYRMLIQNIKTGEKKTYVSQHQGGSPGFPWKCVGVLGYYEKEKK